ncbi:MAG TPA: S8 family serine peptidase [Gemmatimonadales bacterium]|nr:S8 family serine peptidase [Gemmatimonadales bacterium]
MAVALSGCASHGTPVATPKPNVDPGATSRPTVVIADTLHQPSPVATGRPPMAPPESAFAMGLMPLRATGVPSFRAAHPTYDGRGVIIGILDSGIDGGIPGLMTTTTGEPKLLDLRDFSAEGRVALRPAEARGDTLVVGGTRLAGFERLRAAVPGSQWFVGGLAERPLGTEPASDVNGDGDDLDTLAVVVGRAPDGWVLYADTDGNGSLAGEQPIHDYLVRRETFGWHVTGRPSPLTVAANFREPAGAGAPPTLDLFFDTSGHGTHVAGIAAGHDLYGVKGFDGVAPGAYLLGLKIANNAQGGISTTGAMAEALDYAIRFAEARKLPLVLNMSFGVGSEIEGAARIDAIVDSVLARHPDVTFTISAGNDGPGLSTLGFPGSSTRVLTVGATYPNAFRGVRDSAAVAAAGPDPVAFFSARGGELAKPDLVTPGVAYSSVPRWNRGDETKGGTSMASPHASGLATLLVSALAQERRPIVARAVRQALTATARPLAGDTELDDGAGLPDVSAAFAWLQAGHAVPEVRVAVPGSRYATAAYRPRGLASPADTVQTFELALPAGTKGAATFTLKSDAAWLVAPPRLTLRGATARVTLRYRAAALRAPGAYSGTVTGWTADTLAGPAFRLVNTVIVPYPAGRDVPATTLDLGRNEVRRLFFHADSARPFAVRAERTAGSRPSLYLFEPGGMPFRDQNGMPIGEGEDAGFYQVDASDAVAGVYETDAVGAPDTASSIRLAITQSPVTMHLVRAGDSVRATLRNRTDESAPIGAIFLLGGGQRVQTVSTRGSAVQRIAFRAPAWARSAVIDVRMDPAQWAMFTDFGVTLFDSAGRQLGQSPLNYALGRLRVELPQGHPDMPVTLGLFPGLAVPGSDAPWTVQVTLQLQAEPVRADTRGPQQTSVAPRGESRLTFALPQTPWALPDGFAPLGVLVIKAGEHLWTRQDGLPAGGQAVAR